MHSRKNFLFRRNKMTCYLFKMKTSSFYRLYQSSDEMEHNDCSFQSSKEASDLRLLPGVTWSWSVQHSVVTITLNTLLWQGVTERQAGPRPSAPRMSAAARPWPRPRGLTQRGYTWCEVTWGYLRAPPWPAQTRRGCRGRGQGEGGSLPGPRPRPLTRPPRPLAGEWSSSGTQTNWKIFEVRDGENISHYTETNTWYDRHSLHRHTWTFHQYHSRKP